jgi:hypothetical protein
MTMTTTPEKAWIDAEWQGKNYRVPVVGADNNMYAMMEIVPGNMPGLEYDPDEFEAYAMAFLMQWGNLAVPGGRYGRDTLSCAPVAIALSKVMQYNDGEPISYYKLDSDMGLVVNGSDDVAYAINNYAELVDLDPSELLDDDDYIPNDPAERLAKHLGYGTVREYAHGKVLELDGHQCLELLEEITDESQE